MTTYTNTPIPPKLELNTLLAGVQQAGRVAAAGEPRRRRWTTTRSSPPSVAGNQLGDLFMVGAVPQVPQMLAAKAVDLTPHLSGDNIKKYPYLANLPEVCWNSGIFDGKIYGVPVPRGAISSSVLYSRADILEAQGLEGRGEERRRLRRAVQRFDRQEAEPFRAGHRADTVRAEHVRHPQPVEQERRRPGQLPGARGPRGGLRDPAEALEVRLHPSGRVRRAEPGHEDPVRERNQPARPGHVQRLADVPADHDRTRAPRSRSSRRRSTTARGRARPGSDRPRSASPRSARRPRGGSRRCSRISTTWRRPSARRSTCSASSGCPASTTGSSTAIRSSTRRASARPSWA